jgi:hypothetical protein
LIPFFVIMRAMLARFLLLPFLALMVQAQSQDAAEGQLSVKILSHLAADELARITWNDLSPAGGALDAASIARLKAAVARGVARRPSGRKLIDITVTLSWNSKDYSMLIAEIPREEGKVVEMVDFPRPAHTVSSFEVSIEPTLLWTQTDPILDIYVAGDRMLVLGSKGVARYERREGAWTSAEMVPIPMEPVRDPRGRLEVDGEAVLAEVPGLACKGSWTGALTLECAAGGSFVAGRNTFDESGWPPYFSHVTLGGEHLLAETDGKIHVYDEAHRPLAVFTGWGSDFVITTSCAHRQVLAVNDPPRQLIDTISLFDMENHAPIRKSEEAPLPGTITALLAHETAVAIVRNSASNQYEAYRITVACVH